MGKKITTISTLLIFIFIATLVKFNQTVLTSFDMHITKVTYNSVPSLNPIIKFITTIGNTMSVTIIVIILAVILLITKKIHPALFLIVDVSVLATINSLIKTYFARPRPNVVHLVAAGGFSFPSGHSASSMALFISLVFILGMISHKKWTWVKAILIILPILIGCTRIYLGVHYFSDVLAGWSYSLAFTIIIYQLFQKKTAN